MIEKVKSAVVEFLLQYPKLSEEDVTVACYGVAFKPDIDDLRESPALRIVQQIGASHQGPLLVIEPNIQQLPDALSGSELTSLSSAHKRADVHVYLVAHKEFGEALKPVRYCIDAVGV